MSDPRFGDLIRRDVAAATSGDIVIIGIPTDEGIRRNGGREGAAQAPDEIRKYLRKLTPVSVVVTSEDGVVSTTTRSVSKQIFDHGNITGSSLEDVHQQATEVVREYISRGCFVISLGGGHDITYAAVSGVHKALKEQLGLINIDAHLDVREKKNGQHHSGSSFRLLIEDGCVDSTEFTEFGIQSNSVAQDHINWVHDQGGDISFYEEIKAYSVDGMFTEAIHQTTGKWYLSFDIDSIRSADAPGCSAPSPIGFTSEEAIMICTVAAASKDLVAMDIVEVSPPFDRDGRTSRLAAKMIAAVIAVRD
ncbi:MAG TPA: formimidoylglutamase [Candidatus Kapabacteria bacterium]|nr:formimidoylglutamase [Candidatus Kapabacteria bacterium]